MGKMNMHAQPGAVDTVTEQLRRIQIPTVEDIQEWLAAQIAEQIGSDADEIDIRAPFSSYGLTSLQATSITTLGTQQFGLPLSPLLVWSFPNIESLSQFLVEELATSDVEILEI
ncbi:MAG: acyl carrier protein [Kovacikia sp.]